MRQNLTKLVGAIPIRDFLYIVIIFVLRYGIIAISFGFILYLFTNGMYISILFGILVFISAPIIHDEITSIRFSKHLSKFGESVSKDRLRINQDYALLGIEDPVALEIENYSVMGVAPFNDTTYTCSSMALEEGIVITSQRTKRLLPWREIKYIKHLIFLNQPVIELAYHNLETKNRLLIPWDKKLNERIPDSIQQYNS